MEITRRRLGEISTNFLTVLEREGISSILMARDKLDERLVISEESPDYLEMSDRPSNAGTTALTFSYISPNFEGIPLEVRLNTAHSFTQIYFKCAEEVEGYKVCATDVFGNKIHKAFYPHTGWNSMVTAVNKLKIK